MDLPRFKVFFSLDIFPCGCQLWLATKYLFLYVNKLNKRGRKREKEWVGERSAIQRTDCCWMLPIPFRFKVKRYDAVIWCDVRVFRIFSYLFFWSCCCFQSSSIHIHRSHSLPTAHTASRTHQRIHSFGYSPRNITYGWYNLIVFMLFGLRWTFIKLFLVCFLFLSLSRARSLPLVNSISLAVCSFSLSHCFHYDEEVGGVAGCQHGNSLPRSILIIISWY